MAKVRAELLLEPKVDRRQVEQEAKKGADAAARQFDSLSRVGTGLTLGLTVPLAAVAVQAVKALGRIETIGAQTEAVIASTGGAANVTRGDVDNLANSIEGLTSVEAESITEGANMLLTFKNISNGVGEGNDIFNQSVTALTDMSVAMGTDAKTSAIQLGKALNDPVAGISALSRVGIQFTEDQKEMIKGFVEAGDVMSAQKVILEELNSQFGGSAEALGETLPGQVAKLGNAWGDFTEGVLAEAMPTIEGLIEGATNLVEGFGDLDPTMRKVVLGFGGAAAAAGPLLIVAGKLGKAVTDLKGSKESLLKVIGSPWTAAFAAAGAVVAGFMAIQLRAAESTAAWREALAGTPELLEEFKDKAILAEIETRGWTGTMEDAGITAGDMKAAIDGDTEALQLISENIPHADRELYGFILRMQDEKAAGEAAILTNEEHNASLETVAATFPIVGGAMAGYIQGTDTATGSTGELEGALESLEDRQRRLIDPYFALTQANKDLDEAQRAAQEAIGLFGAESDEARDAALKLSEAQLDLNAAATRYAEDGGPKAVEVFVDTLREAGLAEEEIRAIIAAVEDLNATPVTNPVGRGGGGGAANNAAGGPVTAGMITSVGHGLGDELFIPSQSGRILSHGASEDAVYRSTLKALIDSGITGGGGGSGHTFYLPVEPNAYAMAVADRMEFLDAVKGRR